MIAGAIRGVKAREQRSGKLLQSKLCVTVLASAVLIRSCMGEPPTQRYKILDF